MTHYSEYDSFLDAFTAFSKLVREEGLMVGLQETTEAISVSLFGLWKQAPFFQYALAALFCTNENERKIFNRIFNQFWNQKGSVIASKITYKNHSSLERRENHSLVILGKGSQKSEGNFSARTTSGANKQESLRTTDFAMLSSINDEMLTQLTEQLVREMSMRIRRKYKRGNNRLLDISATIRKNIQHGGNFMNLHYRDKRKEKRRLIMLLDVSGSMDKYSFYLLRFIWMLRKHFKHVEVFTFSTRLLRITDLLSPGALDISISRLSQEADHWSGGTKIGECLQTFNDYYAKTVLNGRSFTIIMSDGLDTGEGDVLEEQLKRIKFRTSKLIWLNPLKGMKGYQPIQKGMQRALPQIDLFKPAHNLQSLLTLEEILSNA